MNKHRKNYKVLKYFLIVSFVIALFIYSFFHFSEKKLESIETFENPNLPEFISKNLFFIKKDEGEKSLFVYNLDTQQTEKILEYEQRHFVQIDEKFLGLLVSEELKNSVRLFNLETKEEKIFLELETKDNKGTIETVDFYSPTKFAFTVSNFHLDSFEDSRYEFFFYDDGEIIKLADKQITHAGGGGIGFIYNTTIRKIIKFSPDGNKLLYSSPQSYFSLEPFARLDYRIYIFDLLNNTYEVIEDAYSPVWLDNQSIVYSKIVRLVEGNTTYEEKRGLYVYDTTTKRAKKFNNLHQEAYFPKISFSNWQMLYSLLHDQEGIWIYDLATGVNEQILSCGWEPEWITPTIFLFRTLEETDIHEMKGVGEARLFDIEKRKEILLPKDVERWYRYKEYILSQF